LKLFDDDYFALIVEINLNRKLTVVPTSDQCALEFNLYIPVPPDEVIQNSGFHAVEHTLCHVDESFTIPTGRKISSKSQTIYWPTKQTPLWITFKFEFAKDLKLPLTYDENLIDKLVENNNNNK